ncbi:MAG: hypothetical protein RIS35_3605 [Pseudomonadota bacterium]
MNRKTATWLVIACVLAVAIGWGLSRPRQVPPAPKNAGVAATEPAAGRLEIAAAETILVGHGTIARRIPLTGTLRPVHQALVRAKVAGELVEFRVREGTTIRAGDRIARVDPTDFEARVREREAQLRSAEAQVAQAERTRDNNRQLLERNFISRNAFDNAQSGYDIAVAARDAAAAQLAQARKALADTWIVASTGGVIAERFVQPGEKVSPDIRIASIVDLSAMEIEAQVPAAEIGRVRIGQRIELEIEGVDGTRAGRVARIAPSTTAGTRAVPVWIAIDNPDALARAGVFARGALAVERREGVLVVPSAAIRDAGGRSFVYLIANDRIEERTVRTGLADPSARAANGAQGITEIVEGLSPGDRIVGLNLGALRAGTPVTIAQRSAGAAGR